MKHCIALALPLFAFLVPGVQGLPYAMLDFEEDTVGMQPIGTGFTISPSTNNDTNGVVIVDETSDPSNVLEGKSVLVYDFSGDGVDGDSTRFRFPFFEDSDVSNVRLEFDFQRAFPSDDSDSDTRVHVALGRVGDELNNSDFRPFELRILNNGELVVNSLAGTAVVGSYSTSGSNHLVLLANSHDSSAIDYALGDGLTGLLEPNSFHLILNGEKLGEFDFHVTPDPENSPSVRFDAQNEDLGQIAFYQDSKRQGGVVFDNVFLAPVNDSQEPLPAPSGLVAEASSANVTLSWSDNSDTELGYLVERAQGVEGAFKQIASLPADSVIYDDNEVSPDTAYRYRIGASNGVTPSFSVELTVSTLPQLTPAIVARTNPEVAIAGRTVEIGVSAIGAGTIAYQWFEGEAGDDSSPVDGANGPTLTLESVEGYRSYWVRLSNDHGTAMSLTFRLIAREPVERMVASSEELQDAVAASEPGDSVVMREGEWQDTVIVFEASGTSAAPITLRSEIPGTVILVGSSRLEIGGRWLVVDGLVFTGTYSGNDDEIVQFRSGESATDCRLTNVSIIDYIPEETVKTSYVAVYGKRNRIDHCYFTGHNVPGVTLVVWLEGDPVEHLIDRNHFANRIDGGENGWETIRVGTSDTSQTNARTTVERNLFEGVDGEIEIISNKSNENVYRYNTFLRSRGTLTLRHGARCLVDSNYFLGDDLAETGGIRVIGPDHVVVNNYIQGTTARDGAAITLYAGIPNSPLDGYLASDRAFVVHNTFVANAGPAIEVGSGFGSRDRDILPSGMIIANNLLEATTEPVGTFVTGLNYVAQAWFGNIAFGKVVPASLATYFTATNPLFELDPATGIARPGSASPAIDAATPLADAPELDIDGQLRPARADVGADELSNEPALQFGPLRVMDTGPTYLGPNRILNTGPAGFVNQSARARVGFGNNLLIGGFVVPDGSPKQMLIRGIGPSLEAYGVETPLSDPRLTLYDESGRIVAENDDWQEDATGESAEALAQRVGAFVLPSGSTDAALVATLTSGVYTVHLGAKETALGEGLLEVYETTGRGCLVNQSSRFALQGAGDSALAGFVVAGRGDAIALIRGVGPGLASFGLEEIVQDVAIELYDESGVLVDSNVGWSVSENSEDLGSVASLVGAFPLLEGSTDAALLVALPAGRYTVRLSSPSGSSGVVLFELYDAPIAQ